VASRFEIAVLVFAASLPLSSACTTRDSVTQTPPTAVAGVLDLSQWDFHRDSKVALSGEYEFYWLQQIPPDSFSVIPPPQPRGYLTVPDFWNDVDFDGIKISGPGFATYRLKILLKRPDQLALKFIDMSSAYEVFANDSLILSVGEPGKTAATTTPRYWSEIVDFRPGSNQIDLVLWISNFNHRLGGAWETIWLGLETDLREEQERSRFIDLFLLSAIMVMGLYHIALFFLRNHDKPSLYFGLFCFLISLRFMTQGDMYIVHLFPNIDWELHIRIEYLSYYFAPATFALFLDHLYREVFSKLVLRTILIVTALFSGIVILTPPTVFTYTVTTFQVFTLLGCCYAVYFLIVSLKRKREGAIILLAGFVILSIAIVNDILEHMRFIATPEILPFGLLAFTITLTILIAFRFTRAFVTIELQRSELLKEIAERKRKEQENLELQERLTRSQKMEAIGLLAGGVAHDLNNILTGIVTYPDLLLMDLPDDSDMREPLETIRNSGLNAATVVQDLLTLARRGVIQFEALNLNDVIRDYLSSPECRNRMISHPRLAINTALDTNLFNIMGSRVHLKKVMMNLMANAIECQPNGGSIAISTENRYVDTAVNRYEQINEGTYVVFRIEDAGEGIAPADLQKIFEPFYTTKVMGKSGSGLGLAVVWGTVHDHHGFVNVESGLGKGTVFEIYFRVTDEECAKAASAIPVEQYMGKNESILIVDDVELQRRVASTLLERLNYRVAAVSSGEAAVEYLKTHAADLVMLDMIMDPGIDGFETYRRIKEIHPSMKAIIVSGFSETDRVRQAQQLGAGSYLKKPYTLEKIGLTIRAELDKKLKP
jgi:signal transduction histidine kinase/CheY-like chemotaxis protein